MGWLITPCVENPVRDNFAYSRWFETDSAGVAALTVPLEDYRVLVMHPAEHYILCTPFTVTCGEKQVQTSQESTTFDPSGSYCVIFTYQQILQKFLMQMLGVELSAQYKQANITHRKK